jgi:hypothetical protein
LCHIVLDNRLKYAEDASASECVKTFSGAREVDAAACDIAVADGKEADDEICEARPENGRKKVSVMLGNEK